jgi:hypothetical protein
MRRLTSGQARGDKARAARLKWWAATTACSSATKLGIKARVLQSAGLPAN